MKTKIEKIINDSTKEALLLMLVSLMEESTEDVKNEVGNNIDYIKSYLITMLEREKDYIDEWYSIIEEINEIPQTDIKKELLDN